MPWRPKTEIDTRLLATGAVLILFAIAASSVGLFSAASTDSKTASISGIGSDSATVEVTVPANSHINSVTVTASVRAAVSSNYGKTSAEAEMPGYIFLTASCAGCGVNSDSDTTTQQVDEYITEDRTYTMQLSASGSRSNGGYNSGNSARASGEIDVDYVRDTDGDEVLDPDDECPDKEGSRSNGCPIIDTGPSDPDDGTDDGAGGTDDGGDRELSGIDQAVLNALTGAWDWLTSLV